MADSSFSDGSMTLTRLLLLILVGVGLSYAARAYVFESVYAASSSMEPTLPVKQAVLVIKCWYDFIDPKRGDIVLLQEGDIGVLKRIIGLPGESLEVKDKKVLINGQPLAEPYAVHSDAEMVESRDQMAALVLPTGSYFVMGDNRDFSKDSRVWGPIKQEQIKGKLMFVH